MEVSTSWTSPNSIRQVIAKSNLPLTVKATQQIICSITWEAETPINEVVVPKVKLLEELVYRWAIIINLNPMLVVPEVHTTTWIWRVTLRCNQWMRSSSKWALREMQDTVSSASMPVFLPTAFKLTLTDANTAVRPTTPQCCSADLISNTRGLRHSNWVYWPTGCPKATLVMDKLKTHQLLMDRTVLTPVKETHDRLWT